jgi:predicted ATPase
MPALERIRIAGFKSIKELDIELRPINVLIGANGSGKSNFIQALEFLREIRAGRLQEYVARSGGADRMLHFGGKRTGAITFDIPVSREGGSYELTLVLREHDEFAASERLRHEGGLSTHFLSARTAIIVGGASHEKGLSGRNPGREAEIAKGNDELLAGARKLIDGWRVFHFHDAGATSPMKRTASIDDNRALRCDGANLAAFLYLLKTRHPDSYGMIRKTVQLVAPFFDDFQLEPLLLNPETIKLEWRHVGTDAYFGASALSDGTLRFIALATLFLQPEELRPSIIIVDEPELGLHPAAITILAALVRQASATTQVILSTQSPRLLDNFEPEDVLVAERESGATTLRRLEAEPLAVWLEDYSLGQLWEKNEFGGRPRAEA